MELQEFKAAMGVTKLQFHKSKRSDRAIAQSDEDVAAGIQLYWLSNKSGEAANPAFEL